MAKFAMEESAAAWTRIRALRFQEQTDPASLNPDGLFFKVI
jgi:hypothetical protein